ncbi:hypothetical protein Ciccas_010471 [Cichlidogyrus casuarinus]|uniref:Uncharacterized protein n=1 Tax=Cichlidogyrus casuarinus TaxID=1844966 RepID=A0ABD2PYM8_9PLAT
MKMGRYMFGAVILRNEIFIFGGNRTSNAVMNTVEKYDIDENTWSSLPQMRNASQGASATVFMDQIYVLGGSNFNSVEVFNPQTNQWHSVSDLNHAHLGAAIFSHADSIIVAGGFDGQSDTKIIEKYDPSKNKWTVLPQELASEMSRMSYTQLSV